MSSPLALLAFLVAGEQGLNVVGNQFVNQVSPGTGVGLDVGSGANIGTITGNAFWGLGTGVKLETGSSYMNVQSNAYKSNGTNTVNNGSNNTIGGGSP